MNKIADYGRVIAKIKAMSKNFLTHEDFEHILAFSSPADMVGFLQDNPSYNKALSKADIDTLIHRGNIEHLLKLAALDDFMKLYHMSGNSCRRFMKIYFKRYEINILKECLNQVFDHRDISYDINIMSDFLRSHTMVDIDKLSQSKSEEEFLDALANSEYFDATKHLEKNTDAELFDYEIALDLYYFRQLWVKKNMLFSSDDRRALKSILGSIFDILNIIWIYRSKTYYNFPTANIQSFLIPECRYLDKDTRNELLSCENASDMNSLLSNHYYFKKYGITDVSSLEANYSHITKTIFIHNIANSPWSVAPLYYYMFRKEREVIRLTVALECIRYGLPVSESIKKVEKA